MKKTSFIIATKDRPHEVDKLLNNIRTQSVRPDQVIIVDSGRARADDVVRKYPELNSVYLYSTPPSATRQRNEGLRAVDGSSELIGFLDDDILFEDGALERMLSFWEKAAPEVGGAGFNLANHPPLFAGRLKSHPLSERLGFYSRRRGAVLRSGFQTMIGTVDRDMEVEWLPSGAVVWRKSVFTNHKFDEWFAGYSYLEDLDFSYSISRELKLYVISEAGYYHFPAPGGRGKDYEFGKKEVLNRLHFVRKHASLSSGKCLAALFMRTMMNVYLSLAKFQLSYLKRALGNLASLMQSLLSSSSPRSARHSIT